MRRTWEGERCGKEVIKLRERVGGGGGGGGGGSGFPSLALMRSSEKAIFRGPCNAALRGGTAQQSN